MTTSATRALESVLTRGEMKVLGQVRGSSNAVLVVEVDGVRAVHKPVAGERPLWDFAEGTLALRERCTWLVSRLLGWDVVPVTVLRDGPWGTGSLQVWVEDDESAPYVDVVPQGEAPPGWLAVLAGEDGAGNPVDVVHRDDAALRRLALLDVVVNNSDRKGGHVLTGQDGGPVGIDHGLTFHEDPKLRTVLWGWVGEPLHEDETAALRSLADVLVGPPGEPLVDELRELLTPEELDATTARVAQLVDAGRFPAPDGRWPSVPWPPF